MNAEIHQSHDKKQRVAWDRYSLQQGRAGGTEISSPWLCVGLKGGREGRERSLAQGSGLWLRALLV